MLTTAINVKAGTLMNCQLGEKIEVINNSIIKLELFQRIMNGVKSGKGIRYVQHYKAVLSSMDQKKEIMVDDLSNSFSDTLIKRRLRLQSNHVSAETIKLSVGIPVDIQTDTNNTEETMDITRKAPYAFSQPKLYPVGDGFIGS